MARIAVGATASVAIAASTARLIGCAVKTRGSATTATAATISGSTATSTIAAGQRSRVWSSAAPTATANATASPASCPASAYAATRRSLSSSYPDHASRSPLAPAMIEGPYGNGNPIPAVSSGVYPSHQQAEQVVSIVGIKNAQAAYFRGDTKRMGDA